MSDVHQDVYQEGYQAFNGGLNLDDNPYAAEAQKQDRWIEGWEDAKIDGDLQRRSICRENPSP